MVRLRQTAPGTARRCAGTALVVCAAAILLLFSQRIAAQGRGGERVVEGILEVQYEDSPNGARLTHFLNTGTERIPLHFHTNPPHHLLTGSRVRSRGTMTDGTLMLTSGTDSAQMTTVSLASPNTFGVQSTLVILFNFVDLSTQPWTTATAQSVTFTDVNNFDLENSFGQTSLTGTVAGWFTIAAVSTTCNYATWAFLADQAASNAGFNVASYPRRVYAFPAASACFPRNLSF